MDQQRATATGLAATGLRVEWRAADALGALAPQWDALAADAAEANPFFARYLLEPALSLLPPGAVLACTFDEGGALAGLVPLAPGRTYARLPIAHLETAPHRHCFFGAPLVRRGMEDAFFAALYAAADTAPGAPFFLRLNLLDSDGPLLAAAERAAAGRAFLRWHPLERALLKSGVGAEAYLETAIRAKKRKEWRRQQNRLAEEGAVRCSMLNDAAALSAWTDAFLALEAKGWKGRAGSALAAAAEDARFFRRALAASFAAGALRFFRLDCDGAPIAMVVTFIEQGEGFSFKIAHDEAFARYSPGVLIEVEMLKHLLDREPDFRFCDSCARPDHPMIGGLWRDRRRLVALQVSLGGARGRAMLRAGALIEGAAERLRRRATAPAREEAP